MIVNGRTASVNVIRIVLSARATALNAGGRWSLRSASKMLPTSIGQGRGFPARSKTRSSLNVTLRVSSAEGRASYARSTVTRFHHSPADGASKVAMCGGASAAPPPRALPSEVSTRLSASTSSLASHAALHSPPPAPTMQTASLNEICSVLSALREKVACGASTSCRRHTTAKYSPSSGVPYPSGQHRSSITAPARVRPFPARSTIVVAL